MNELKHLLFLTQIEGLGAVRTKRLIDKFGSAENVFSAEPAELAEIENISAKSARFILDSYKGFNEFDNIFEEYLSKAEKLNITILPLSSPDYPDLLKRIYDPPVILYIRGNQSPDKLINSIGIVGTRKPTDYGKKNVRKICGRVINRRYCGDKRICKGS